VDEVKRASDYYWETKKSFDQRQSTLTDREEIRDLIVRAFDRLLTAETSCNFYWGSRWVTGRSTIWSKPYICSIRRAREWSKALPTFALSVCGSGR